MIETAIQATSKTLPVMEAFYTIQGEGYYTGHAAYFIRLGGCDVGCHWCDVKDSWDASIHPHKAIEGIVNQANNYISKLIVITGGEPLMHDLDELTTKLNEVGLKTNIETSGVCEQITGQWNWICFSPKKFKTPNPKIYEIANELKVIIYNQSDFKYAEENANLVNRECVLYLQPEWSKQAEMMPLIVDYVKNNPKWTISLQTHKFMNIP
jgi:7-carboxy-7-deazaguanine synthase